MRWPNQVRPGTLYSIDSRMITTASRCDSSAPSYKGQLPRSLRGPLRSVCGAPSSLESAWCHAILPPAARACGELWTNWEDAKPRPIRHVGQCMVQPQFVPLPQTSLSGSPTPHLVLVPLQPEDRAFNYIPAIVVSPARLSVCPKRSLEEQFDAGLTNWGGGTEDWILDPAGRTHRVTCALHADTRKSATTTWNS